MDSKELHARISQKVKSLMKEPIEFFNFRILKKDGDLIKTLAQQNNDFLGQVCVFGLSSEAVQRALDIYTKEWSTSYENHYSQSHSA